MAAQKPLEHSQRRGLEELVLLHAELDKRQQADPLRSFTPHAKQQAFIDAVLQGKFGENWFIAANRAGKSDAGAYIGATLARFGRQDARYVGGKEKDGAPTRVQVKDRATAGWVSALDFPTSRDVIQPKYFDNGFTNAGQSPFIPEHEIADWRVADQILKLKNGSIIGFKSADSGSSKYQGAAKDWVHFDEEHPYAVYEEAVIRVGSAPLIFFCTATILPPEGVAGGLSWVFPKLIQPWLDGQLPHVGLFGASIYDNPAIPRQELARLEAIYPEGSAARRIRLEGEWLPGIGGSRAYTAFNRQLHVRPQPLPNYRRPLCWTWDFNVDPMCSVVGQRDGEAFRIFRNLVIEEASIPEMCQLFYETFPKHAAEIWLYGDATSKGRSRQTGKSDYWQVLNEMRSYGVPIRMKVPESNPAVPDRVNAVNRLLKDEYGQVRLEMDPSCTELIADMEQVLRDERGGIKKVYNRKDPYFRRTHSSDALGYWLSYEEPVRPRAIGDKRKVAIPAPSYTLTE